MSMWPTRSSRPHRLWCGCTVAVYGWGIRPLRRTLASKPEYFTSKLGFILVSVNYRLLPEGMYPTNVQDVADALAWVQNNIADFGGDPQQIYLRGIQPARSSSRRYRPTRPSSVKQGRISTCSRV